MNLIISIGLLLIPLQFNLNFPFLLEDKWEPEYISEKIKVYSKKSEDSNLKDIKISGVILANLESVINALNDVETYPKWVNSCVNSYQFNKINDSEYYYYTRTKLPFHLSDRDLVVHTTQFESGNGVWHSISRARPSMIKENYNVVRIKYFASEWKIKKETQNSVKFEYRISMDPGGYLPVWIVNIAKTQAAQTTIRQLEKRSIELMNKKNKSY
ncbi:MAG TPA: hypothetical protein ENK75_02100 [Saprospiraceae bacterium]|nr:hypothetical protein [Saprospiraceae bacterium]